MHLAASEPRALFSEKTRQPIRVPIAVTDPASLVQHAARHAVAGHIVRRTGLFDAGNFLRPHRRDFLVGIDNFAGGYLLADHLIKLGAKRLAFVTRPFSATTVDARKAGASVAMIAHGLTVPRDFLHAGDSGDVKFVRKLTAAHQYDVVICTNDHTAALLLQTLTRLDIKVPQNLRVVGFDNVRFATLISVPLTTIQKPCGDIALTAFNAMRERIANPTPPA